ncbi:MAG: FAD-binding protein [Burkholderiales bacterium]|jgi:glycolate oxidase|nr:FAD-binding protein [Burkholderiales bacterium]
MGKPELFPALSTADRAALLTRLGAVLPATSLLWSAEDTRPYECDGLSAFRRVPLAVVLPETEQQVVDVLRICRDLKVPVVPRGAGTGLSGGALPMTEGVTLGLSKMKRILAVDPLARTARVQPGVRNLAISEAVAPHGLYYAPDPSSQIACSIGGNIAENSGGVHCLKYGLTVHNVHALRMVTIDGDIVELGGLGLDAAGYDLMALAIGSEGMLGIVTEITVKLLPKPVKAQVVLAAFDSVVKAGEAVAAVIGAGIIPAGLEMMDQLATRAVEQFVHAGYPLDAAAILLCESDGTPEEVASEIARVIDIMRNCGATEVRCSRDDAERLRFWSGRKSAFPAVGRLVPDYYCMDGTIPKKNLAAVLDGIARLSAQHGMQCANVFHAGDGNLHPLIMFDANVPGQSETAERFGADILELCVAMGGTITGEHGVGMEKIDQMCVQFTTPELDTFHAVKRAFDPHRLLNPDKAIPTLARCADYGAMRVSRGALPFPELPRF